MAEQNKKIEVLEQNKKIAELIRGLRYMNDGSGCYFLFGRLEVLANAMRYENTPSLEDVNEIVYLQQQIINQIRFAMNFQDKIIAKLKQLISDIYPDKFSIEDFQPCSEKLEALRDLEALFVPDHLGYHDRTSMSELKTWCTVYDFDIERVKDLLGNKESEKPAIASP